MHIVTKIAATAVEYAKKGKSIIPLTNDKHPMIKFADKPALTVEEATNIWTKHPVAMIGMITTDFFVIDADRHKGGADGIANLDKFAHEHEKMFKDKDGRWILEETLAQRTAGGGLQFFFKKPKGITMDQVISILPAVDIKGAANNYVVVPPSIRNGKEYEWIDVNKKMIEPPATLVDYIINNRNDNSTGFTDNFDGAKLPKYWGANKKKGDKQNLINALNYVANGIAKIGKRNTTFTSFVGTLLANGIDVNTAWKLTQMSNDNTAKPLPEKELNQVFTHILERELKQRTERLEKIKKEDA